MEVSSSPPPFDTAAYAPADRFAVWCAGMAGVFDGRLPENADPLAFHAAAECRLFGPASIISGELAAVRMTRTGARTAQDGLEAYAVVLYEAGEWSGDVPGGQVFARTRVPVLLDMSRPLSVTAQAGRYLILNLSRPLLDAVVPVDIIRHGTVLGGAAGALLREQLLSLDRHSAGLFPQEGETVAASVARSVAACLPRQPNSSAHADPEIRRQAMRYIDGALQDRNLSVDRICAALGVSRSKLYRAFRGGHGIDGAIRRRRLDGVFRALSDPSDTRAIRDLREAHGFQSASHFSTAFRRRFGCSPNRSRDLAHHATALGNRHQPFDHHGWKLLNPS